MAEIVKVVEGLKRTRKGKLLYDRENFQDIFAELRKFQCLSIQPLKYPEHKEKKEEIINVSSPNAKEKSKINNAHDNQVSSHNFANISAEVEHELLKYELERKDCTKKLVADKRRSWEKYEQMMRKENEEKIELLRREQLDKNSETVSSCTEEAFQNTPVIPEQETDAKTEATQDKTIFENESDERNRSHRRNLEEALHELNCNISSIVHKIQSIPHHIVKEIDISIQFLRKANEILQHTMDNNQQILSSDVETALSYVSISKQVLQTVSDLSVETEEDASSKGDGNRRFVINASSPEKKEFEQVATSEASQSPKVPNMQQEESSPHLKLISGTSNTTHLEHPQESPFIVPVGTTAVTTCAPVSVGNVSISSYQKREPVLPFSLSSNGSAVISGQSTYPQKDPFLSAGSMPAAMHTPIDHISNSSNSQLGSETSSHFSFSSNNSFRVPGSITFSAKDSSVPSISMPAVTTHASVQNNSSVPGIFPCIQTSVKPLSVAEIQKESGTKLEVEQMDSVSSQGASQNENVLSECVPREALRKYLALEEFLKKWRAYFEEVILKPEWKKRQLLLLRAVNTPINCMSSLSGAHLLDKIERLDKFLSGESVEIAGEKVSINVAPEAKYFCMDLLAKKLVSQGESQVSSQPEDAFPLAAAMVYLWQKYPDLGLLFMAHLYKKCPYTVPYYIPQQEGQSEEEYYKALGYHYTDAGVEKLPHFLKRMSGFCRLYFAVLQTQPKLKKPHPHGIGYGWRWMAHIMNLEPRPDITATVLLDLLEVCGYAMQKHYGKQFKKLLLTLVSEFLPKIKRISSGSLGPVVRLEKFLKETLEKGFISPPSGVITDAFWRSS